MATNAAFPPYEYYEGGKIVGIDAEMAAAIADILGMKLVIEDTEFGSIVGGVQSGKYLWMYAQATPSTPGSSGSGFWKCRFRSIPAMRPAAT